MRVVCLHGEEALEFAGPLAVLRAERLPDVAAAFAAADRAVAGGDYVAGFVGYEAGGAFVPRQAEPAAGPLPFVQLGIFRRATPAKPRARARDAFAIGALAPLHARSRYDGSVADVLRRIRAGDVYQTNLAVPFGFAFAGDPEALFTELSAGAAYPYAAYVEAGGYAIVSCSPELFVRFDPPYLITKPMKGTASRDDLAALASDKNRAEHLMIVDLLRNDMHRLDADVSVERFAEVERYPEFATMTSTIVARRATTFGLAETFAAMFPCGSVTGAPKVTAMNAIAEREDARGIFCGSIGYRAPGGRGSWNVAIRTATIDRARGRGVVHVGGGIVADSDARSEWAEILTKRRFFDRLAPAYGLLETLWRDADGTYRDLEPHVRRLAASADALHFDFDESRVRDTLARATDTACIVRLELRANGDVAHATRPLVDGANRTLVWSTHRVPEREPLQGHKTTWRPHYDRALAEARAAGALDAILCTADGYVADGARTNVFIARDDGGALLTPPIADGALPGILRGRLLQSGEARECRLTRNDVATAHAVYAGSSVRGLVRARIRAQA